MAYSELVKNFEKVRSYMREFYVYGFKSRTEYDGKSARSYDDERRRIESWLGEYMRFSQSAEGKSVFLSVDSRAVKSNPFYKAWKTKSFTDGDITLHFILFDILYEPGIRKSLSELVEESDARLSYFPEPMSFDESTLRKKLKEYEAEGIIQSQKQGRRQYYSRSADTDISACADAIDFFSEAAPCGLIGSYLRDKGDGRPGVYSFKHHYITGTLDSEIMVRLFDAMHEKRRVLADNLGRHSAQMSTLELVPLKIYISAQNGRQHLIAFNEKANRINAYRLDYLSNIRIGEPCLKYDELRREFKELEGHMWGVNCRWSIKNLEHVEFDIRVAEGEGHIVRRLEREKRCGRVEKLDEHRYRFTAEVFDSTEMLPWIRSFICRITRLRFSNRTAELRFKNDLQKMYGMYGIDGGEADGIQ